MLTVKHIDSWGYERIWQTTSIVSEPGDDPASAGRIVYAPPVGEPDASGALSEGDVYVMNDNGKTVAVYRLARAPVAQVTEEKPLQVAA